MRAYAGAIQTDVEAWLPPSLNVPSERHAALRSRYVNLADWATASHEGLMRLLSLTVFRSAVTRQ